MEPIRKNKETVKLLFVKDRCAMFKQRKEKIRSTHGISVVIILLVAAILVMVVLLFIPILETYGWNAGSLGCAIGIYSAQRKVDNTSILEMSDLTAEEAMKVATQSVADFSDLCPVGGEVYLEPRENGGFEVLCGIHDSNSLRRTRLNSGRALERLREKLDESKRRDEDFPENVSIKLNGTELLVTRTETDTGLNRGTNSVSGYEGTVAFYRLEDMDITYFSFADENHAATWRKGRGWDYDTP